MKKIIGIAAAALMSLALFACDSTTTKTTRTIEDVPYSTNRVVRRVETKYKAPRVLTPKTTRTYKKVDAPNLLPYVMSERYVKNNTGSTVKTRNATHRTLYNTPYVTNN